MLRHANLLIGAISGFIGAIIMTVFRYILRAFGQDVDIPYLLGTLFIDADNEGQVIPVGIMLHLLIGACWGMLYVTLLVGLGIYPNWPAGLLWGFAQGIFIGILLGTIANSHPYIGDGKPISDPGIMGRRWSPFVPYWILLLHVIFGGATMYFYHLLLPV